MKSLTSDEMHEFEELQRIKKFTGLSLDDLEDLAMEHLYPGVYNIEKEDIIMQNTLYKEGKETAINEIAQKLKEAGRDLKKYNYFNKY